MSHMMALLCSSETRCRSCGRFEAARFEWSVRFESRLLCAYLNRMSVTREIRHRLRASQPEPRFEPCLPRLVLPGSFYCSQLFEVSAPTRWRLRNVPDHPVDRRDCTRLPRTMLPRLNGAEASV